MGVLLSLLQLVFAYVKGQEDSTYPLQMVRFPLPQLGALRHSSPWTLSQTTLTLERCSGAQTQTQDNEPPTPNKAILGDKSPGPHQPS